MDDPAAGDDPVPSPSTAGSDALSVILPGDTVARYRKFSLYNSPYPAHDRGCAVDLYPESNVGVSPVAGVVRDTRTVRCPDRPYAVDHDHLVLVDVDVEASGIRVGGGSEPEDGLVARILHVDPDAPNGVEPGDEVAVGDPLGEMVRSGFFGQWVDNHVHLGFRAPDRNPYRAAGSLPLAVDATVEPVTWDGTGTVVETGATHAVLDAPAHPAAGSSGTAAFAAIAADDGCALDGGLAHYSAGGLLSGAGAVEEVEGVVAGDAGDPRPVSLLGHEVGVAHGRDVTWGDVALSAGDQPLVGLSLFAGRDALGAKLVAFDHGFAVGDEVRVRIEPTDDPVRLD
ncbi:hypothetical protein ACFO0N_08610 [Halobium salinum]|uniref:Peptidase M23 n=1 Tax=Halobium salinum TaxID=1364940 RepID=A0ABD5PB23_9EURY|nr:hypothetical protein [Halobium salinum]